MEACARCQARAGRAREDQRQAQGRPEGRAPRPPRRRSPAAAGECRPPAGRAGAGEDQSDTAHRRPPRRRLSPSRQPRRLRRRRPTSVACGLGRARPVTVTGPTAARAGPIERQSRPQVPQRALAERVPGPAPGPVPACCKRLPVAAGIGGGSSDAAAALRLLAQAQRARARCGARPCRPPRRRAQTFPSASCPSRGACRASAISLSAPIALPRLPGVLVNPGCRRRPPRYSARLARFRTPAPPDPPPAEGACRRFIGYLQAIAERPRDRRGACVVPAVAEVLSLLAGQPGCRLVRMSGSGRHRVRPVRNRAPRRQRPRSICAGARRIWWIRAATIG